MTLPSRMQVSNHPVILHKLTELRDCSTQPPRFRQLVRDLSSLLMLEACQDLMLKTRQTETPLITFQGVQIAEQIGLVPILRAGLGMAEALIELLPESRIWHLGLFRDHDSHHPVTYYNRMPAELKLDRCLVLDPMLATGGSTIEAISLLKNRNVPKIQFLGLIAAPEGVRAVQQAHPDVSIHLAALDSHLNDQAYIVPGLGDAGDRQFGTY